MPSTVSLDAIPHRPPFLFIDEVIELAPDHIIARKLADPEADFFRGHYPGQPVMPGVLIAECCFQAGALLIAGLRGGFQPSEGVPVLTRIQDARFRRMVRPGDLLSIEVTLDESLDEAFYLTGRVHVDGQPVLRVGFACMLASKATTGETA